jgi:hypothetical protein
MTTEAEAEAGLYSPLAAGSILFFDKGGVIVSAELLRQM